MTGGDTEDRAFASGEGKGEEDGGNGEETDDGALASVEEISAWDEETRGEGDAVLELDTVAAVPSS